MNLDERLNKDIKRKPLKDPYYEDEPDYEGYIEHKKQPFLNENGGVFDGVYENSFNIQESVFDKQAVFKVGTGERSS